MAGLVIDVSPEMLARISTSSSSLPGMPRLLPPTPNDPLNPSKLWLVCDDWESLPYKGRKVCVRAPVDTGNGVKGFYTDGISVPSMLWTIFRMMPFSIPELTAALPHDMLYAAELVPRKDADRWMRHVLSVVGLRSRRVTAMYYSVRAFGGNVWKTHTDESVEAARSMCQVVPVGEEPKWE